MLPDENKSIKSAEMMLNSARPYLALRNGSKCTILYPTALLLPRLSSEAIVTNEKRMAYALVAIYIVVESASAEAMLVTLAAIRTIEAIVSKMLMS